MQYPLKPYQDRAVQEMMTQTHRYNAYEMGAGKTRMMLELLHRTGLKGLVIAPLLVAQRTWPSEVKKFGYPFRVALLHGPGKEDLLRTDAELKVVNWDGLKWLGEQIEGRGSHDLSKRILILDEPTAIKAPGSVRFGTCKRMQHFFKAGIYCLSGTPMPNGYIDLWTQYWMLDRGKALEPSFAKYKQKYFFESGPPRFITALKPGAAPLIQNQIKHLTSIMLAEEYTTAPEATYTTWHIDLPRKIHAELAEIKKTNIDEETGLPDMSAGVVSNKLRQVTQGALYINEKREFEIKHLEKVNALAEILEVANGNPILCPTYFRFEVEMIRQRFGPVPVIAGGMNLKEKQEILDNWDKGKIPLLLVHPASLSHGVNMQYGGHWIVWYGLPWSLEQYQQLNGRLIRPGQTESVNIIHISARSTKDQRVFEVLENKHATQEDFMRAMNEPE